MKDSLFWKFISDNLHSNETVVLMVVVDYEKGSPGKTGFKLAVTKDDMIGTIGGGVMEYNLIQSARNMIGSKNTVQAVKKLVHNPNTVIGEPSGLVCSGSQTMAMISLSGNDSAVVDKILSELNESSDGLFSVSSSGLKFSKGKQNTHCTFNYKEYDDWIYSENIGAEYTVVIIGGGHVGLAVARVLQSLEFNLIVIDDRSDAPAMIEKTLSIRKIVSPYGEIGKYIEAHAKNFIVIVTSAMQSDKIALQQVLVKKFDYIGIMGTTAKVSRIISSLTEEEQLLSKSLHAPIGIHIHSKTPEEIAISIAAELIKVKNEKL